MSVFLFLSCFLGTSLFGQGSGSNAASVSNKAATNALFGTDIWLTFESQRISRGMDITGSSEIYASPNALFTFRPSRLFLFAGGAFSLFNRADPFNTDQLDQFQWKLWTDWTVFNKVLRLVFGVSLYNNVHWPLTRYGAATAEIFWKIGFASIFSHPTLCVYHDLTPSQNGTYWVLDFRESFHLFKQRFDVFFNYGHSYSYQKQGTDQVKNFVQLLGALAPMDLGLHLHVPFKLGDFVYLVPNVGIHLITAQYQNRESIEGVVGFTAHFAAGVDDVAIRPFH